ncbi:MAG: hypothetical protein WDO71_22300 [Bacteroidota bacterium]
MRNLMNRIAGLLCILLLPCYLLAQEKTISGKITDGNGVPLPGVSIAVKQTSMGTFTDAEGEI